MEFLHLSGFLWVAWVRGFLIQVGSFWDARASTSGYWIWRKLLKYISLVTNFIRAEV